MKKIAITIQNFVQFYSLKNYINTADNVIIDLYVPISINDLGFDGMFDDIYNYLKKEKYRVYRKVKKIRYDILLEPYPMDIYFKFNYKFRIKYKYCAISAKPHLTYKVDDNIYYDAILCHSTYEQEIMDCFAKTFLVGRTCFYNFQKKKLGKIKTILYLPTYGDLNSINDIADELKKLSKNYNIIVKEHHGTNYLNLDKEKKNKLSETFSKVYDSTYSLTKLLELADVVLTDNSGAIFESLYANVPVCIFSKKIDSCSTTALPSLQQQLVESGEIPYTNNVKELESIIIKAVSKNMINKQHKLHDSLFPIPDKDILSSFTNVINMFLDMPNSLLFKRINLHRTIIDKYVETENIISSLQIQTSELQNNINSEIEKNRIISEQNFMLTSENKNLKQELDSYKNGKLYKISTKIYSFKSKFRRKK